MSVPACNYHSSIAAIIEISIQNNAASEEIVQTLTNSDD
jgi:hypothetical protein